MRPPQVLVAGAGPVGLTLAAELVRHGVTPRVVDAATARSDKSKALVLWSRTLELLDAAGAADPFVSAGIKGTSARLYHGARLLGVVPLSTTASAYPYGLFIPQSDTERLLEEHLQRLGITVERDVALTGFVQDEDGVVATLRHGRETGAASESVRVDWLVGCDGAHSTTRHTLRMPFAGTTEPTDWMLADVLIDGVPHPDAVMLHWHAEGMLALFPIGAGRFRVVADLGPGTGIDRPPPPTLGDVQAVLDRRGPGGLKAHDPVWLNHFRINERKVARYREGRVFLAGDAAHIHSPAGGQGMNTGMQDAVNLAWKLGLVCRGEAVDGPLLDSYSAERSAVGDAVLRNAGALTRVAIVRNPLVQAVRNIAAMVLTRIPAFRRRFAERLSELDIRYPESPLNRIGGGVPAFGAKLRPGDRVPDTEANDADGRPTRLERLLRAGRFVVLDAVEPNDAGHAMPMMTAALGRHARLCVFGTLAAAATPWATAGARYVVRPDGYLAFVGKAGADAGLGEWMRFVLGQ